MKSHRHILFAVIAAIILLAAGTSSPASAKSFGGGGGSISSPDFGATAPDFGTTAGTTPGTTATSTLQKRHLIALDYALENKTFLKILENAGLKAVLSTGGVPPKVTSITLSLKRQFDRLIYVEEYGFNFQVVHQFVAEVLEVFLVGYLPEGFDWTITAAKAATAFMTAYAYGFTVGYYVEGN